MTETTTTVEIGPAAEFPAGESRIVEVDGRKIGVFNVGDGEFRAIEDRCSHDDGPLAEGSFDADACTVECPRHGSLFDLNTGRDRRDRDASAGIANTVIRAAKIRLHN